MALLDQEPCVYGLGLFGHWHSWSCVLIDGFTGKVPHKRLKVVFLGNHRCPLKCRARHNKLRNSWEDSSRDSD